MRKLNFRTVHITLAFCILGIGLVKPLIAASENMTFSYHDPNPTRHIVGENYRTLTY